MGEKNLSLYLRHPIGGWRHSRVHFQRKNEQGDSMPTVEEIRKEIGGARPDLAPAIISIAPGRGGRRRPHI